MTVIDDMEFLEVPAYHHVTKEYMGIEGHARIHLAHRYFITKEAEARGMIEVQRELAQKRSREIMKTMILKAAMEILQSDEEARKKALEELAGE